MFHSTFLIVVDITVTWRQQGANAEGLAAMCPGIPGQVTGIGQPGDKIAEDGICCSQQTPYCFC